MLRPGLFLPYVTSNFTRERYGNARAGVKGRN